jgi:hypothetical protein
VDGVDPAELVVDEDAYHEENPAVLPEVAGRE